MGKRLSDDYIDNIKALEEYLRLRLKEQTRKERAALIDNLRSNPAYDFARHTKLAIDDPIMNDCYNVVVDTN
jgi:hypothetical protein